MSSHRLAVLADVHGNVWALEAVLAAPQRPAGLGGMDRNREGATAMKINRKTRMSLDFPRRQALGFLEIAYLIDERDRRELEKVTAFVCENPDCLLRSNLAGHLTASAFVTDRERKRLLLIHHKALGRWLQPGGHADGDPDLMAVARYEVFEETGLRELDPVLQGPFDLDIHSIPERAGVPAHLHYDVRFLFAADGGFVPQGNDREVHRAAWVPLSDLAGLGVDESVLRPARRIAMLP